MRGICSCTNFICKNNRIYILYYSLVSVDKVVLPWYSIYSHPKKGEIYEEPRSKVEPFVLSDEANKFAEKKSILHYCVRLGAWIISSRNVLKLCDGICHGFLVRPFFFSLVVIWRWFLKLILTSSFSASSTASLIAFLCFSRKWRTSVLGLLIFNIRSAFQPYVMGWLLYIFSELRWEPELPDLFVEWQWIYSFTLSVIE